ERGAWAEIWQRRGDFFAVRGLHDLAVTNYAEAIAWMPENARLHYLMGDSLEHLGRLEEAEEKYHEALRIQPNLPGPRTLLALGAARRGEIGEALDLLREDLLLDPESARAQALLDQIVTDIEASRRGN